MKLLYLTGFALLAMLNMAVQAERVVSQDFSKVGHHDDGFEISQVRIARSLRDNNKKDKECKANDQYGIANQSMDFLVMIYPVYKANSKGRIFEVITHFSVQPGLGKSPVKFKNRPGSMITAICCIIG